jgi:hypothetical protein
MPSAFLVKRRPNWLATAVRSHPSGTQTLNLALLSGSPPRGPGVSLPLKEGVRVLAKQSGQ